MTPILGIDPGNHGAAVIAIDGDAHRALVWTRVTHGLRIREWSRSGVDVWETLPAGEDTPYLLGRRAAHMCPAGARVVYEGLFVGSSASSSARDTLGLAEWVGEHRAGLRYAPLLQRGVVVLDERPLAQVWRRATMGHPWGRAKRAEAEAEAIRRASWLPRRWTAKERGAAAEAWLLAVYAGSLGGAE